MKIRSHCVAVISLLTFATSAVGQADPRPRLPDQFAEVVLRVEGMT